MRIFLSWSGERSKFVASLLDDWLVCVLQACRPWISTKDIDKGSLWFSEISDQLRDISVGIICLTQDNKHKPWILFEAGALAKGLSTSRVCTLLIDLEPRDVSDPLAQFNHTLPNYAGIYSLVKTINTALGTLGLDPKVLDKVFDTYWPQFEERFKEIIDTVPSDSTPPKPRESDDILAEILEHSRNLASRVRKIESDLRDRSSMSDDPLEIRARVGRWVSPEEARAKAIELVSAGVDEESVIEAMRREAPISFLRKVISEWKEANDNRKLLGEMLSESLQKRSSQ